MAPAVRRAVDRVVLVGDPDVDRPRRAARRARRLVEGDPGDALVVARVPGGVGRVLGVVPDIGEVLHLRPGDPRVRRPPQPVAAGRAEVQHAVLVRVDREPFAHAAPRHVAAQLERQLGLLPARAPVVGAQHGTVRRVPVVGVRADGRVHLVGVDGVGGEAHHPRVPPVVPADRVKERGPGLRRLLPAVGAADVGAGVGEVLLGAVEDDAGDEAAPVDARVLPGVRRRRHAAAVGAPRHRPPRARRGRPRTADRRSARAPP